MLDEFKPLMSKVDPSNDRLCIIGESDPFLAQLIQRFAEKSGLWIQQARTGNDVLEMVKHGPVLVILDPELPGKIRGWEAAQSLRDNHQTRDIPLIICSWLNKNEALAHAGMASAYLEKPNFGYEDFTDALNAVGVK